MTDRRCEVCGCVLSKYNDPAATRCRPHQPVPVYCDDERRPYVRASVTKINLRTAPRTGPNGERAYRLRVMGYAWSAISAHIGVKDGRDSAKKWAASQGAMWPPRMHAPDRELVA